MTVKNRLNQTARKNGRTGEISVSGRAVSRGIAVGTIVCLYGLKRQFFRVEIEDGQIESELLRFRRAVELAGKQLETFISQKGNFDGATTANIFNAHVLILADSSLSAKIEEVVIRQKINAEWAVEIVTEAIIDDYKQIGDEHLRERYIDLKDVSDRLLNALGGEKPNVLLEKNAVIVAREVKPSTLIELSEMKPTAIITETGGWTSHTFILAREMNLPAVTGIDGVLRLFKTGDKVIVDGYDGKIILNPTETVLSEYETAAKRIQTVKNECFEPLNETLKMLDGRRIKICVNADLPAIYSQAQKFGARGIGLYRSEFLFNQNNDFPREDEQIEAYKNIADMTRGAGVKIRTFDLSAGQLANETAEKESNPALGLRAIRLGLFDSKQFRVQLSALLQASAGRKIDIVLPMISDVAEITAAKQILEEEKERLKTRKVEFGKPLVGAMIEVPSAVFMIEEIARAVDFLCLGTNDLVQYLLAADRDNPAVADWFRSLHPAVVRAIKKVLTAAEDAETPVIVCGEMAGSPFYAPVLIGLGATDLSMNVNSILRVGRVISGIAFEEARELAKQLETCATADESENAARSYFLEKWSHLYVPDALPPPKK